MRTYHQLLHLPHHYMKTSHALFTSITLRTFFFSYFSLFIPAIIFSYYQSFGFEFALTLLSFIYLVIVTTPLFAFPLITALAVRLGYKPILITSQVLLFTALILMKHTYFFPGAFLFGLASICWWISYYVTFLDSINTRQTGRNIGVVETLGALSSIFAPLIGGFIITYTNQSIFYLFSLLIILISIFPLFFIQNRLTTHSVPFSKLLQFTHKYPKDLLAFIGAGAEGFIYSTYWPLFLYFILKSPLSLGIFASLITLLAALLSFFLGKHTDQSPQKSHSFQKIGIASFSLSWIGKSLWQSPLALSLFDIIHRIFNPFFVIPLNTTALYHAQKDSKSTYITFREIGYRLGNIVAITTLLFFLFLKLPFWLIFILAALASFTPIKLYQT